MEKLNVYLQRLVSAEGSQLRLEPNKKPYVVATSGNSEISGDTLKGSKINSMIFSLIPHEVKEQLPSNSEVEFVHPHNLGEFSFLVQKSPAGFNVTIAPVAEQSADHDENGTPEAEEPVAPVEPIVVEPDEFTSEIEFNSPEPEEAVEPKTEPNDIHDIGYTGNDESDVAYSGETPTTPELSAKPFNGDQQELSSHEPPGIVPEIIEPTIQPEPDPDLVLRNAEPAEPAAPPPVPALEEVISEPTIAPDTSPEPSHSPSPQPEAQTQTGGVADVTPNPEARAKMDKLFRQMSEIGCSDLHLSVSVPPMVRKDGKMDSLANGHQVLSGEVIKELLMSIMPRKNIEEFGRRNDTDFAYEIPGLARFRANIFMDRKGMGGVFRIIPSDIMTAEDLQLSKHILGLCELSKGLVVVTGPTGSGKSTTLCAMVDYINKRREDHIITIEDPIEFTHENNKCLVNQREVHNHTDSFKDALRAALREDPDILLVGEMRDLETIAIAIETAETGHLVFGTLHTTTAASTVDRIIDQFPADRQQQVRVMLSESLRGVIAQTLLPKKGGGRIAALEVLIVTPAISNLIREGKTFQIPSAMQTGKNHGMVMLNDGLMELVKKGIVEPRDAYIKAVDKTGFELLLKRNGASL